MHTLIVISLLIGRLWNFYSVGNDLVNTYAVLHGPASHSAPAQVRTAKARKAPAPVDIFAGYNAAEDAVAQDMYERQEARRKAVLSNE